MNRFIIVAVAVVFQGCLSVDAARENASQRSCQHADKCGDIGSGQTYASFDECLTKQRANWQDAWPTSACDGKINGEKYDVCIKAIDNTQCNNILDSLATLSKCTRGDVCSAGSGSGCNCGNGQTCCNNACVNMQTDRNNCGGCGTTCGSGLSCQSGVCR